MRWAGEKALLQIDDYLAEKADAVCVIGWAEGSHDSWIAGHGARDLRNPDTALAEPNLHPVVAIAMKHAGDYPERYGGGKTHLGRSIERADRGLRDRFQIVPPDPRRSLAVRLYVSGRHGFPSSDPDAVRQLEDSSDNALLGYVEDVVQEMFDVFGVGDWDSRAGISAAVASVEAGMASRHPELDRDATEALAWMWSYRLGSRRSLTNRAMCGRCAGILSRV